MKTIRKSLALALSAFGLAFVVSTTADAAYVCRLNPYGDNYLSFRTCASTRCGEMLRLGPNTYVRVIGSSRRWRKVRLSNGSVGWVYSKYLCY